MDTLDGLKLLQLREPKDCDHTVLDQANHRLAALTQTPDLILSWQTRGVTICSDTGIRPINSASTWAPCGR